MLGGFKPFIACGNVLDPVVGFSSPVAAGQTDVEWLVEIRDELRKK